MEIPIDSPHAMTEWCKSLLTRVLSLTLFIGPMQIEMSPAKLIPFNTFIKSVKDADANDFLGRPASKIKDAASFEEMRQYILSLYRQVHVDHSYVLGSQTFDCIPVNQQPSVRALGSNKIAREPQATEPSHYPVMETTDKLGNTLGCEDRTIPMRRITLQQLSQFRTLKEFLQKGPNSAGHAPE